MRLVFSVPPSTPRATLHALLCDVFPKQSRWLASRHLDLDGVQLYRSRAARVEPHPGAGHQRHTWPYGQASTYPLPVPKGDWSSLLKAIKNDISPATRDMLEKTERLDALLHWLRY